MAKIFICDRCKKTFNEPLDEEYYTDENGVSYKFDLCAVCREDLRKAREDTHKEFFGKIIKGMKGK